MKLVQVIKIICFLAIFGLMFVGATKVLQPKWINANGETLGIGRFNDMEDNSVEVACIGSSQIVYGMDNACLYEDYGISSYSLAGASQPIMMSYAWLNEALKTQKDSLKVVVYDVSPIYAKEVEASYKKQLDNMKLSKDKLHYIFEHDKRYTNPDKNEIGTYLFPIVGYHTRWNELSEQDFSYKDKDENFYRGYHLTKSLWNPGFTYDDFTLDGEEPEDIAMVDIQKEYFLKIVDLCKENDIKLVLVKTPNTRWSLTRHNGVEELANQYNLPFIDMNFDATLKEINFVFEEDMKDINHCNARGAKKVAKYIGAYLKDNYELTDYRNVDDFDSVDIERYKREYNESAMKTAMSIESYIDTIGATSYDGVIYSTKRVTEENKDLTKRLLKKLKVDYTYEDLEGKRYIAVFKSGILVDFAANESLADIGICAGSFNNGVGYAIDGKVINIGGIEKKFDNAGLNALVYDSANANIVDKTTITQLADEIDVKHEK